jgi:hypothetical protein
MPNVKGLQMFSRPILIILAVFHLANGLSMVAGPMSWYAAVPGVANAGPFNHHFVTDIGLGFVASGLLMLVGSQAGGSKSAFALAGALLPALHAALHLRTWITEGVPTDVKILASEAFGVMATGFLGLFVAWRRAHAEGSR